MKRLIVMMALGVVANAACAFTLVRPPVDFYVAPNGDDGADGSKEHPVASINRAVELTRAVKKDVPKRITVADGTYAIARPIRLDKNDYELTIAAEHPGKVRLTGARHITGWRKYDGKGENDDKLLVADMPFPMNFVGFIFSVGDDQRSVARWPEGHGRMGYTPPGIKNNRTIFPFRRSDYPANFNFKALDTNTVWIVVPQEWGSAACGIKSIDLEQNVFHLKNGTSMDIGQFNQGYWMCNVRCGLTKPGQWMYDFNKKHVLYWPFNDETPELLNEKAQVACASSIFYANGASDLKISGFVMDGCIKGAGGYGGECAAVTLFYPGRTLVEDCQVSNCGGDGIYIMKATRPVVVSRCKVFACGGTGIDFAGGGSEGCKLLDSEVYDVGRLKSENGVGMQMWKAEILRCKIHDLPGCGITMWGYFNVVASNELYNCMKQKNDGGALYGAYDWSLIKDNVCRYTHDSAWSVLYNDEGGQHTVLTGNIIEGVHWPIHLHINRNMVVTNNIFRNANGTLALSHQLSAHDIMSNNELHSKTGHPGNWLSVSECDEWVDNEMFSIDEGDKSHGKVTLHQRVLLPNENGGRLVAARAYPKKGFKIDGGNTDGEWPGGGRMRLVRDELGRYFGGVPGCSAAFAYDERYLYVMVNMNYSVFIPYPGQICALGHWWGHTDSAILYLNGCRFEFYPDGTYRSHLPDGKKYVLGKQDYASLHGGWKGGLSFEFRIRLVDLGFPLDRNLYIEEQVVEGSSDDDMSDMLADEDQRKPEKEDVPRAIAKGKTLKFNVAAYNSDHDEYRYLFLPVDGNMESGTLIFNK